MIDQQQLADLRAKAEAATHKQATAWVSKLYSKEVIKHIAAANPATVLAMIDEIERLRKRVRAMNRLCYAVNDMHPCNLSLDVADAVRAIRDLDAAKETTDG